MHFDSLPFLTLPQVLAHYFCVVIMALLCAKIICVHSTSWVRWRNREQEGCLVTWYLLLPLSPP